MKLVKVGAAVLNQTPLDWDGNKRNILGAIADAKREGVSILCLPELCISGYGCEDAYYSPDVARLSLTVLAEMVPETRGMIVSFGLPLRYQNALFNVACLVADGKIRGFVAKQNLAGGGIYYEPRWFKPWPEERQVEIEVGGESFPLGDIYFDCGGIRVGFEICEDAWVARRPGSDLSSKGVDIILNPSASHFAFGKFEIRKRFVLEGSRAFGVTYVYTNLLGNESGRAIYDGGVIIASGGQLAASGSRFSFADREVTAAVVDIDSTRTRQVTTGSFNPDVDEEDEHRILVPFTFPALEPEAHKADPTDWEESEQIKEEEFTRAESLGLFDYLRKSRSRGFVVSMSGGADSATVACLVAQMVHFGVNELGTKDFLKKLGVKLDLPADAAAKSIINKLLLCVYQSTENSSDVTRTAAREVSEALGAEFVVLDVDVLVKRYTEMAEGALGRKLTWADDDVALQNIQARTRAPGVWLLANVRGALLLVTSNRSEAAVGYATMDGDTAGSLSPLGGIDKAFIRNWLRWMESTGPAGLFPVPALSFVNAQQPTAELRPPGSKQTDESDLMPYEFLDLVERAALLDRNSPLEILKRMAAEYPKESIEQLSGWIRKFFTLWCRNQWKRERYAPAFHLDDQSLDPKTWCRFPILSGGYARELAEMEEYVKKQSKKNRGAPNA